MLEDEILDSACYDFEQLFDKLLPFVLVDM